MKKGIIIFGLNGSGKTTLGRALAKRLGYKHMDIEDYIFLPSQIPYTKERSREEYLALMLDDIVKSHGFVLSGSTCDYGEEIAKYYDFGIFLEVPYATRIERVIQRSIDQYGDRVKEGGDMYTIENRFLAFVKNRKQSTVDNWAATLTCPLITLDGRNSVDDNVDKVIKLWSDKG